MLRTSSDPQSYSTFGQLLRYLRRRARLTQRDLGIAAGYSEGHINRFEKDKYLPDPATVTALFIPALELEQEPELARRLVELAQHQPAQDAGQAVSAQASLLLEPIPPASPFEIPRTKILQRLESLLPAERCVLLTGMAGSGKTSLAAALARHLAGTMPVFWLTLTGGMLPSADGLLSQLALFLAEHGQPNARQLLPQAGGQPAQHDRLLAAISTDFHQQPALLCFDNAEALAGSEACLQVLLRLITASQAWILLISRESLPLPGITEIIPGGLDQVESLAFIDSLGPKRLDPTQAFRLFEKTGGNPMLIRLSMAQLSNAGVDADEFVSRLDSQPQVSSFLLETVQKQSTPTEWQMLCLLAVFAKPINLYDERLVELIQSMGASLNFWEVVGSLQRRHLIDDPAHASLNPLLQEYVYRRMGPDPGRRQRLHRLAGDWFQEVGHGGLEAASHYLSAGLFDEAVEALSQSARMIINRGEALAAVAMLDEILARRLKLARQRDDALHHNDLQRRILAMRGYLLTHTLRSGEAEENFRQALALTSNPALRAGLIYQMKSMLGQTGRLSDGLQLIQSARLELSPADLLLHAQLYAAECQLQFLNGQMAEAERCATQAIALANQVEPISPATAEEIRSQAYYALADLARGQRRGDAALEYAQCALASARKAGVRIREIACLAFIGGLLYDSGDLKGSRQHRQSALTSARAIDDQVGVGYYLTYLASIDYLEMQCEQALEKLKQAIAILSDTGEVRGLASAMSQQVSCWMLAGDISAARLTIQRVVDEMECQSTKRSWGYYLNKLAMVQMVENDSRAAQARLQHALALPAIASRPMLVFELQTNLALAQAAAGQAEQAKQTLDAAPPLDGLSLWTELDRDLVSACVALTAGETRQAANIAAQVMRQCRAYPYYYNRAQRLARAAQAPPPASSLPRLIWVGVA